MSQTTHTFRLRTVNHGDMDFDFQVDDFKQPTELHVRVPLLDVTRVDWQEVKDEAFEAMSCIIRDLGL